MDREEVFARHIESRLIHQSREHWTEFSSIIAGANGLLLAVLIGRIVLLGAPTRVTWAAALIAVASAGAMLLAYTSIQLGSLVSFGAASPFIVGSSFALATGQFGLFLVPVSVLDPLCQQRRRDSPCLVTADRAADLRHWLLAFASFALCAALVNWAEAVQRQRVGLDAVFSQFHAAQRTDRLAAIAAAATVTIIWGVSFRSAWFAIFFGAILVTGFVAVGIFKQSTGRNALESDLRRVAS